MARRGYGTLPEFRDDPSASSHQDFGRGYQATGYSDYNALVDEISSNIFTIGNNATMLEKSVNQVGTNVDSAQLRDRIHQTEQNTNKVISKTMDALRRLAGLAGQSDRIQKLQYDRLTNEFKVAIEKYNGLQKQVADKVKSSVSLSRPNEPKTGNLIGWNDDPDEQSLLANESRREQMMAEQEMLDTEVEFLRERDEQIRNLESDILDINQIFRDLGALVYEQGEVINTIESNVETAASHVEGGAEQLEKAARYQRRARKKMCILVVILLVLALIVTLIIVFSLRK
ncbi:hypothetical protein CAPTEDRAFT_214729 [Capitella teleta]|uniref:t-SNARE coiled-coil homology domain-containing protein n=1 Tax=Capitella teleta TaxID=283909 RepID=R7VCM3_CAPTE|nr:hypothetical protein CAPTEDRAFT_214729 [Capitella teleta]|eukprot:ELU16583.1 hypothetical protein CAPTEDRAFT_214729 [Capitella teleta]